MPALMTDDCSRATHTSVPFRCKGLQTWLQTWEQVLPHHLVVLGSAGQALRSALTTKEPEMEPWLCAASASQCGDQDVMTSWLFTAFRT